MIDDAEPRVRKWAETLVDEHDAPTSKLELHQLVEHELAHGDELRRAMAQLPPETFVAALLHHTSVKAARDKVRDVERISMTHMSRRSFWDHLDRVNYFVAGFTARS